VKQRSSWRLQKTQIRHWVKLRENQSAQRQLLDPCGSGIPSFPSLFTEGYLIPEDIDLKKFVPNVEMRHLTRTRPSTRFSESSAVAFHGGWSPNDLFHWKAFGHYFP
jgi:hypothetical protein